MGDWLLFSEEALETISSKWKSKNENDPNKRFVQKILEKMERTEWRKDKKNDIGVERWETRKGKPIFSVELTPGDFLFFEPIFTFDLIKFIQPIINKESYGENLDNVEKSVSLHLMIHKIDSYPKRYDRINFEGNEYTKCDRFFVDKLTNPKKEEFKYQKELVYVNQLQLLKVLNGKQ